MGARLLTDRAEMSVCCLGHGQPGFARGGAIEAHNSRHYWQVVEFDNILQLDQARHGTLWDNYKWPFSRGFANGGKIRIVSLESFGAAAGLSVQNYDIFCSSWCSTGTNQGEF